MREGESNDSITSDPFDKNLELDENQNIPEKTEKNNILLESECGSLSSDHSGSGNCLNELKFLPSRDF